MRGRLPATAPTECPICGADVPRGALACPECGADERTGWNEESTRYDGLDLPAESFEDAHDPASRKPASPRRSAGASRLWWIVGLILLVALLVTVLRH